MGKLNDAQFLCAGGEEISLNLMAVITLLSIKGGHDGF